MYRVYIFEGYKLVLFILAKYFNATSILYDTAFSSMRGKCLNIVILLVIFCTCFKLHNLSNTYPLYNYNVLNFLNSVGTQMQDLLHFFNNKTYSTKHPDNKFFLSLQVKMKYKFYTSFSYVRIKYLSNMEGKHLIWT